MSLIWQARRDGRHYQVRGAGRTRRLYTDGVLHSQYHPQRPLTGNLWDLLGLPALWLAPGRLRRVLVLGVGGGAVIRMLTHFFSPDDIVGVDSDALHLLLARRFFGLRHACLVRADARDWLRAWRGPDFDYIVDDLFVGTDGEPRRALPVDAGWRDALLRRLRPGGVLVVNFASAAEARRSALRACAPPRRLFSFSTPQNENRVHALVPGGCDSAQLRERIVQHPDLARALRRARLRYQVRRLA